MTYLHNKYRYIFKIKKNQHYRIKIQFCTLLFLLTIHFPYATEIIPQPLNSLFFAYKFEI